MVREKVKSLYVNVQCPKTKEEYICNRPDNCSIVSIQTFTNTKQRYQYYLTFSRLLTTKAGRKQKMAMTDMSRPPIVPAAKGNQNASRTVPTMKGIKPRMVLTTVRKMGTAL